VEEHLPPLSLSATEADVRVLLRDCGGFGGLEAWIAGRRWKAAPGGWTVTGELQGWQFQIDVVAGGLRPWSGQTRRGAILARAASMLADAASSRRAMLAW
jgi:hypothetical protein